LWAILLLNLTTVSNAQRTINVPADSATVQGAISIASPGDTVIVAPGVYMENINFQGKAITVEGASGGSPTVIDGTLGGPVVTFSSGETRASILSNLTLQHGATTMTPSGGGIYINGASPTIQNDILENNTGCGIGVFNGAPLIQGTMITNTTYGGSSGCLPAEGTGVLLSGYSTDGEQAQLLNNTIEDNNAQYSPGGIYLYRAGAPRIENNVIVNNESDDQGGGILMQGDGAPAIVQNLIYGNVIDPNLFLPAEADTGAGINLQPIEGVFNTSIYVTNNTIVDNLVEFVTGTNQQGTQVYVEGYYDRIAFTNNVIVAPPQRSAIDCELSIPGLALPQFDHNDVFNGGGEPAYSGSCPDPTGTNGNISADPLFAAAPSNSLYAYQVQLQSPAVDSGNNGAPDMPSLDILGQPRIQNAKGLSSAIVDMGVYEYKGIPAPPPPPPSGPIDFALTVTPSSLTVPTNQQGTVAVVITPINGFRGVVSLTCLNQPFFVLCAFQPQQLSISGDAPEIAQLIIGTVPPAGLSENRGLSSSGVETILIAGIWLPGTLLFLFVPGLRRSTGVNEFRLLTSIMVVCALLILVGCGLTINGYQGTYKFLVSASAQSANLSHSANLTFTVTK
jgi:parallel beta-helix repeat protein